MSFVRRLLGRKMEKADKTASVSPQDETQPGARKLELGPTAPTTQPEPTAHASEPSATDTLTEEKVVQNHQPTTEKVTQDSDATITLAGRSSVQRTSPARGLCVGYASDVGRFRDHNEDTLVAFQGVHLGDDASDPFGFFIVTDGMGGHQAGEVASSLAARLASNYVLSRIYLPFLLNKTPGTDMAPVTEVLRDAVQQANDQVTEHVPGGGTTLTCALILGRRAYIAHVGDSRAYLLSNNNIRQVTQDHSYVGRLIELGELSPEEAVTHPQRHVLYRAIGQGENLDVDTYQQSLPPGSGLLLCSDGLSGSVSEEEIKSIIAAAATPQEACERLLDAANNAGGPDNITAVLIQTPAN
jgi:serine/threonine protein phosphatase PrpC